MRSVGPQYPVDRYLVESSKKVEMVNIIDDEIWNPEPALRPEEEIILRKLHEMLQSTADDLKVLSGELARGREPATQVRAAPTPLDEEFNEKVHIEEVVNAKFHGYKIVDKHPKFKEAEHVNKPQNVLNTGIKPSALPTKKQPTVTKRLTISRTNVVQINATQSTKQDKVEDVKKPTKESVAYNEFSFQYPKAKVENVTRGLQVQTMPSINIRSELKEQKVLHLDIVPQTVNAVDNTEVKSNVAVITVQHDAPTVKSSPIKIEQDNPQTNIATKKPVRKVTKIVTCESSTSTNNISSDPQCNIEISKLKNIRGSPKTSIRIDKNKTKNIATTKAEPQKRTHHNLDEWKKKLNSVYGQPSSSRKNKTPSKPKSNVKKIAPKIKNIPSSNFTNPPPKLLNNAQYIPYSQLTLGGVNVSDIEKEISNIPNKNSIPLSPILDKIISSRENSTHNSPKKNKQRDSSKILTTSDENLLQEVIDIEKTVSKTLSKNVEIKIKEKLSSSSTNEDTNGPDSYVDDFEDEKSENARSHINNETNGSHSDINSTEHENSQNESSDNNIEDNKLKSARLKTSIKNTTFSKLPNLTLKNRVDIFEYVHAVDTQDTATQIQTTNKISLKETQTSPRNETPNVPAQPIHNNLWPSIDPGKEVEKMFKLEKDLIKKLIIDEYGDLLQRSIDKPSTSKENQESHTGLNLAASQKVTQTSPKHVKSVMTSPTKTKTRTTSPFASLSVDHQTSPMIQVTNEEVKVEIGQEPEDLGLSINLSSPRFSLRLPNTSLEVLSNLEICSRSPSNGGRKKDRDSTKEGSVKLSKTVRKNITSSTSIDADNSSSEISSLGEIKFKLKKRLKKSRVLPSSESLSSSSSSKLSVELNSAGVLPLRSEGEVSSLRRPRSRGSQVPGRSDGEISFGNR